MRVSRENWRQIKKGTVIRDDDGVYTVVGYNEQIKTFTVTWFDDYEQQFVTGCVDLGDMYSLHAEIIKF